jgi:hypothetical protein
MVTSFPETMSMPKTSEKSYKKTNDFIACCSRKHRKMREERRVEAIKQLIFLCSALRGLAFLRSD